MRRNLLSFAALSLLILPLSANAGEGFSAVDRASAESAVGALAEAGALAGHPLPAALSKIDIESPYARQTLAPFVEALAAEPGPATAETVEMALAQASLSVSKHSRALAARAARASPTDLNTWKALSAEFDSFAASYGGYLPAHEALAFSQEAASARERVAGLREGRVMGKATGLAEALDERKAPETVAEGLAPSVVSASALAPAAAARVEQAPPAVPAVSAAAKGPETANRFNLITAAYYLGGGLVLAAMVLFAAMNASSLGAGGLLAVTAAYGTLFIVAGSQLKKRGYPIAGGVLATCAVAAAPLAVLFLEQAFGLFDLPSTGHLGLDLLILPVIGSTLGAALAAAKKFRFSFLAMPAAAALVGLVILAADMLGIRLDVSDTVLQWLAAGSGAGIVAFSVWLRKRVPDVDYGFWLTLAGGGLFVYAMSAILGAGTLAFALVGALTVAAGALLDRRALALFGGVGIFYYIGDLTFRLFGDSQMLPFALIVLGGGIIASAVIFQKKFSALQDFLRARLSL